MINIVEWIESLVSNKCVWYIKRLSANDTLANNTHQAGPYIPKEVLFQVFPEINNENLLNPDIWFDLCIDSHEDQRQARAIWYNNKLTGGTRDETRVTQLGGRSSALLNPENTGALTIFMFVIGTTGILESCRVWVCSNETEEELIEEKIGTVEPGQWTTGNTENGYLNLSLLKKGVPTRKSCWLKYEEIPEEWKNHFPSGLEIIQQALSLKSVSNLSIDRRLLARRSCEYELFRSVEEAIELPLIKLGFNDINTFVARAQTILQRRKARAGRSLELHAKSIFIEEGLRENIDFSHGCESEGKKKPDFIFPSESAYKDECFAKNKLRMLAVKTTCKDRWRQILNEADRIEVKHLLTLQEGVSENQFQEMSNANVRLVVPQPLIKKYPERIRSEIISLERFINEIQKLTN